MCSIMSYIFPRLFHVVLYNAFVELRCEYCHIWLGKHLSGVKKTVCIHLWHDCQKTSWLNLQHNVNIHKVHMTVVKSLKVPFELVVLMYHQPWHPSTYLSVQFIHTNQCFSPAQRLLHSLLWSPYRQKYAQCNKTQKACNVLLCIQSLTRLSAEPAGLTQLIHEHLCLRSLTLVYKLVVFSMLLLSCIHHAAKLEGRQLYSYPFRVSNPLSERW